MKQFKATKASILVISTLASSASYASGFAIQEQSVTGLGRAFAGSAAVADDASTVFFNPAGLTQLNHTELAVGLHYISPQSDFTDDGSRLPVALGGTPLSGGDGGDAGEDALVPNLYYAQALNSTTFIGLGINAPFGLVTDYSDTWQGRYHALRSDLKTININPSLAIQANEKLSIGFGINLQYIDLELSQAVDFGAVCAVAAVGACAVPQGFDGKAKLTADDWSWGYNLGLLYQLTDTTRVGLTYRSKISHHLKGDGEFRIPDNAAVQGTAAATGFSDGDIDGRVTLPESASLAVHHQLNNKVALSADVSWTRWSRFVDLTINSDDSTRLNSTKEEDWENSLRYAVGVDYQHNDKWAFRTGVAYDETPLPGVSRRTPRIPGNDRIWFAVGASYKANDNLILDAGYTHLFINNPKINDTDANGYILSGEYEASVDILSVQARYLFN
jgi:long-chain fatty acid transport protein